MGRKLTKRRNPVRASSVQFPDRLKEGEDAYEDVTATKGKPAEYLNQSIFSMINKAGSNGDFNARFQGEESSDSEDEHQASTFPHSIQGHPSSAPLGSQTDPQHEDDITIATPRQEEATSSDRRGRRSLPKLNLRTLKEKNYMSQSTLLTSAEAVTPRESSKRITPRDAPVMSKMLEAQAELNTSTTSDMEENNPKDRSDDPVRGTPSMLDKGVMQVFGFEKPEEVISGRSDWFISYYMLIV